MKSSKIFIEHMFDFNKYIIGTLHNKRINERKKIKIKIVRPLNDFP